MITATTDGVSGSGTLTVSQVATQLVFSVQPSDAEAGAVITPPVEVAVQDDRGNLVTTGGNAVTMEIGNNPSLGTLSGRTAVDAVNGRAAFPDLSIDKAGTGYTLIARSIGLKSVASNPFNITAPPVIVFAGDSAVGLSSGVFKVDPDGTNRVRLDSRGSSGDVHPRLSPSRQRAAYTASSVTNPTNALFVAPITADTAPATVVSDTSTRRPRWSLDGVHLAFECGDGFSPAQDVCVIPDVTGPISFLEGAGNGKGKIFVTDFDAAKTNGPGTFAWDPLNPSRLAVVRDSIT
ncbi:MAG: hypothetical protein ACRDH5_14815, partial [bacterium]